MRILLIILAITSSSCSTVKYQPVPLPLPPEIQDRLTQEELECVSDTTLNKIILLDKRRKTLRGIIESTHNDLP